MKLDPKEKIASIPMLQIRKLLIRGSGPMAFWGTEFAENVLGISPKEAQHLIQELEKEEIIERDIFDTNPRWQNTIKGNAIAMASTAKSIKCSTVERALSQLLDRVDKVKNNPYYLYKVTKVLVFGSYLSDTKRLNDVDVAIELEPKETDKEERKRLFEERRKDAAAKGRTFNDLGEWLWWPYLETFKYLKSRSQTFSFHDTDDGVLENTEYKVIYSTN